MDYYNTQMFPNINYDDLKMINSGSEGFIYLYQDIIIKNFRIEEFELEVLKNKEKKLKILQSLQIPTQPSIYDFYYLDRGSGPYLYAYSMDFRDKDKIDKIVEIPGFSYQKKLLLSKMWQNVLWENEYGIYNFDIRPKNYNWNIKNGLSTLDIDSLQVAGLPHDVAYQPVQKFMDIKDIDPLKYPQLVQNYAMLICILNMMTFYSHNLYMDITPEELKDILPSKINNADFLKMADAIIDGQEENVDDLIRCLTKRSIIKK